jgi:hypothetical protein
MTAAEFGVHRPDDLADVVVFGLAARGNGGQPAAGREHPVHVRQERRQLRHQVQHPDDHDVRHRRGTHRQVVAVGRRHP